MLGECLNPPIADIPEGEWFCPECIRIGRGRNNNQPSDNNTQVRIIARTNFAERIRRNVNANRRSYLNEIENRVIVRKRSTRKFIKRKRVKKFKRRKTTKKKKLLTKKEGFIKNEPCTSSSLSKPKRRIKRKVKRKKAKRVKKTTNLLKLNVLKIKNKYKLSNRTPNERILKRIISQHEQKINDSIPHSEKLSNSFCGFRTVDDEDSASIQLTSQTSDYFQEFFKRKIEEKPKEIKPLVSNLDLLDSIMSSQKILSQNSSNIKLKQ